MNIFNEINAEVTNINIALDAMDVLMSNLEEESTENVVGFRGRMKQYLSLLYLIRESIQNHSDKIENYAVEGVQA